MGGAERKTAEQKGYYFSETDEYVAGKSVRVGRLLRGVVLGNRLVLRYLGPAGNTHQETLRFAFYNLEGRNLGSPQEEEVEVWRRYRFTTRDGNFEFLIRPYVERRRGHQGRLRFDISEPDERIVPASERGIHFE